MKTIYSTLFFLCLLGASPGRAQQAPAEKIRLLNADEAKGSVVRGQKVQQLEGHVLLLHGATTIKCDRAVSFEESRRWILTGAVHIFDQQKNLRADSVTFSREPKMYEARGHVLFTSDSTTLRARRLRYYLDEQKAIAEKQVVVTNPEEHIRLTSEYAEHFRQTQRTRMLQNPVFVQLDTLGQEETRIVGKVMEAFDGGEKIVVDDSVRIYHRDIFARCGHAEYYRENKKIFLTENPVATQQLNELRGDSIELLLENRRVREVRVHENALATLQPDSTLQQGKPSFITGQNITAFLDGKFVTKVGVEGTATCIYHVYENGVYKGMNRTQGDKLTLFLTSNAVRRLLFESDPGKSTGKFFPPGQQLSPEEQIILPKPIAADTTGADAGKAQ